VSWAEQVGIAFRRDREIPLGVQLEWGLRSAIVRGELLAGERLPTLRQLAEDVGANVNTIRAVYARLERDGLLETHHGKGSFVLAPPPGAHLTLANALAQALQAARDAGLTPEALAAALYVMPVDEAQPEPEIIARRHLRAEIAVLEAALSALYAEHPDVPVASRPRAEPLGPRLLDSDDLRHQRDAILDQLVTTRAAIAAPEAAAADPTVADRRETAPAGRATHVPRVATA
jgi:DNA-binding transcriptional regulator YhcF (GntR family)